MISDGGQLTLLLCMAYLDLDAVAKHVLMILLIAEEGSGV